MAGIKYDALNQVYNHYLAEYAPKTNTQHDAHKKDELKRVYNSIVKLNKESPLAIFDKSEEAKGFAIALKENARTFQSAVLSTQSEIGDKGVLDHKMPYSTRPEIATVKYLGDANQTEAPTFELGVAKLASPQENVGNYLPSADTILLRPGAYSFDLSINDIGYEFQFQIREDDTNRDIQQRLARLISNADIGITGHVTDDGAGNSSLKLYSDQSGSASGRELIFRISDENTSQSRGIVDYLGLDRVMQTPSDALFEINGIERSASSNTFTIDKQFEVTLTGLSPTPDITTQIGLKNDIDSLAENIHSLVDSYNGFLDSTFRVTNDHAKSSQLHSELSFMTRTYASDLEAIGLTFDEDGRLSIDDEKLKSAALSPNGEESMTAVKDFANSMLRKTGQISINPMEYVNKTIVAYKNPGKNFADPYTTSAYSGFLFNNYC
ncbi:MAG: flagellar filament capping protein FliD [Lachnospiraceae bacterium]|nr:flagellar filament capping protein FliD [Lachnospiraceae bacterium]